ncbi:MAG: apolipoprotein N-acyltransferase [Burkholderiales bacterium]
MLRLPQSFWVRVVLVALAGAASVLGFAPFYAWPVIIVALVMLFACWWQARSTRESAAIGFAFGFGLFVAGVSWLYVSLHVFGGMPAPMAAIAVALFCAYLSLWPALAGVLVHRWRAGPGWRLIAIMPVAWVGAEMLRAWFLTGFPWLVVGYSQAPAADMLSPLAGYAPVLGVYGISWLLAVSAGIIVWMVGRNDETPTAASSDDAQPSRSRQKGGAALAAIWLTGIALQWAQWTEPSGKPITVSLAQGNVAQHLKWREDQRDATLKNYLELVSDAKGRLIVLPETALPLFSHEIPPPVIESFEARARANGGDLLLGVAYLGALRADGTTPYFNGAISLGQSPNQRYAKQHLVAFGEFVPPLFSWVYQWLSIPLSGFTPGRTDQASMQLAGHRVAVNICYEDTFGREIARPLPTAELLVNVSNMAWYGRSLAADQHAQFSQMRALETGRWMLRSTNTGVTAAIDHRGRIVAALPQWTRGMLETTATPRQGTTPYVWWHDWAIALLMLAAAGLALARGRV